MNRSEKVVIDSIKKLIPINGDLTNFSADVGITASTDEPFLVAIVSQAMLETQTELPYKSVSKQVKFSVRNDNNVYQPYFVVLKAEAPQEVLITINLQETPLSSTGACSSQQAMGAYGTAMVPPPNTTVLGATNGSGNGNGGAVVTASNDVYVWYTDWRIWLGVAIIIAILLWYWYGKKREERPTIIEMSRLSS